MKMMMFSALALALAIPTQALACAPSDFTVRDFKMKVKMIRGKPRLQISGKLVNNCAQPAGAKIKIVAKDEHGVVIQTQSGWPTGSANIAPGASADFNFGALFNYDRSMKKFSAAIVEARTW